MPSFLNAMEERAYDAVETIDAEELERRVLVTMHSLQPMRDQATRIDAFRELLKNTQYEDYHKRWDGGRLTASDLLRIEEQLVSRRQGDATTIPRLTDNDRAVILKNSSWARHWTHWDSRIKHILAIEPLAVRVRNLATSAFIFDFLAQAPISADYNSVTPALTRAVASKFAFDCAIKDYKKLMDLSDQMPLLMYHRGEEDEAIVEIKEPKPFQTDIKFYDTHDTYMLRFRGDNGWLSKPVVLLEEADVSSTDDPENPVTFAYVEENYPFIPESVKDLLRFRPGDEGYQEARSDFVEREFEERIRNSTL